MNESDFVLLCRAVASDMATPEQLDNFAQEILSMMFADLACGAGFCSDYPEEAIDKFQEITGRNLWQEGTTTT